MEGQAGIPAGEDQVLYSVYEVLLASILGWVCHSFSSESCFVRTFAMTCLSWVAHSFIELHKLLHHDKAVICKGHESLACCAL